MSWNLPRWWSLMRGTHNPSWIAGTVHQMLGLTQIPLDKDLLSPSMTINTRHWLTHRGTQSLGDIL